MRFFIKNICLPVCVFWLDLIQFFLFKKIYLYCTLITYWHYFFTASLSYYMLFFMFIIIQSLCMYNSFLFFPLYLFPLTCVAGQVKKHTYAFFLWPVCMLALSITLQNVLSVVFFHQKYPDIFWTTVLFFSNIVVLVYISLKKKIHAK
ncbi:MAG TPA: hypothetical protein VEK38_04460 [Candidatus Bathyarchaeia archaeon]|nr:hypothetical protein [Candidatus Bathyarchaeia archaeon]